MKKKTLLVDFSPVHYSVSVIQYKIQLKHWKKKSKKREKNPKEKKKKQQQRKKEATTIEGFCIIIYNRISYSTRMYLQWMVLQYI